MSPSAWRAWARGVVALGAPARVWTRRVGVGARRRRKRRGARFAHYELFSGRNMPFPFDRIEEKLLKIVPHARLHGTTEARRPPGPPRPGSREDPYAGRDARALALAALVRATRARTRRARRLRGARDREERNESYDRFGALRNDLERETMSNATPAVRCCARRPRRAPSTLSASSSSTRTSPRRRCSRCWEVKNKCTSSNLTRCYVESSPRRF